MTHERVRNNSFIRNTFDRMIEARQSQADHRVKNYFMSMDDTQLKAYGLSREKVKSTPRISDLFQDF